MFVSRGPPPGLTGDPMQDSLIVDKLVNRILNEYELNTKERVSQVLIFKLKTIFKILPFV